MQPSVEHREKNYFHKMNSWDRYSHAYVINKNLSLGVFIKWSDNLPIVTHCRLENPGDYFLGIEPCNTLCVGRSEIEKRNLLPIIKPGEEKTFSISFTVLEGDEMQQTANLWKNMK